jgi:hypothetical protein
VLNNVASWNKDAGVLTLTLDQSTTEFQEYVFKVSLTNPAYGQDWSASNVRLSCSGVNIQPTLMSRENSAPLPALGASSMPGDQAPPQVRQPVFTLAIAAQSNPTVFARNTMTVWMESNVDLPAAAAVSLSGFQGAQVCQIIGLFWN